MDWQACRGEMQDSLLTETQSLRNLGDPGIDRERSLARARMSAWQEQLAQVDDIDEVENVISIEEMVVALELTVSLDRAARVASLTAAAEQLAATRYTAGLLLEPENYRKFVDQQLSPSVHRADGLPLDVARLAFRSHLKRLDNAIREVRGPDEELNLLTLRRQAIRNAERLYIARQRQALNASSSP